MPLKNKKPSLEEEYFVLQKQFEEANKSLGGMPSGSIEDTTGILSRLGRPPVASDIAFAKKQMGTGAPIRNILQELNPEAEPSMFLDPVNYAIGGVTGAGKLPGAIATESPLLKRVLQNALDYGTFGASRGLGWAGKKLLAPKAAPAATPNPILQRALEMAKQKALPPGRFTRGVWTPEFKTKSGLEGPMKYSAPQVEKPKFKMPGKTAKTGLIGPGATPTTKAATILPPKAEPVDEFQQYLTTIENVSPEVKHALSNAYTSGGMEALYDVAVEMAKQKKLFVK